MRFDTLKIIFVAISLLAASGKSRGQDTRPTTQPSLSRVYAHEAFTLGKDPALRMIHPVYSPGVPGYWKRYIETNANRYVAVGVRGLILHNPFGAAAGPRYVLDGYQNAPKWLKDDFVSEWRKFHRVNPGFEVIAYFGPEPFDDTPLTVERVRAAVKPAVDAGMSVAFDASALFDRWDLRRQVMRELWADGVPVYCEALANADRPWMGEFHQLVTPAVWQDYQHRPHLYVPLEKLGGHVVVWTPNVFSSPQAHVETYKVLMRQGVMAAGPIRHFFETNSDPRLIEQ